VSRPAEHLDVDALADVLSGEPEPPHLRSCAQCRSALAELDEASSQVSAQLRALGALPSATLPADLLSRLTAAVAASPPPSGEQVPDDGVANGPTSGRGSAAVTTLPTGRERSRSARRAAPAWAPVAAAAVVLLAVVGLGSALLRGGSPSPSAGSAESGGAGAAAARSALPAGPAVNSSRLDYGPDDVALRAALPALLAGRSQPSRRPAAAGGQTSGDPLSRLRDPAALAGCLSALLPPDNHSLRPVALDYAAYASRPALAVILPSTEPTKLDVFFVGPGCSAQDEQLVRFSRVDRPPG